MSESKVLKQSSKIIFIHGYESSGQGFKGNYFRSIFPQMLTPNFTGELLERMEQLNKILNTGTELRLIGSSFGGLMATIFMMKNPARVKKAILMAPALVPALIPENFNPITIDIPIVIYHGKNDEVVPLEPVKKFAEKYFNNYIYNLVDDDHRLQTTTKSIDWLKLLSD